MDEKKLEALRRMAMIMNPDGPLLVLFGFLAGRLDRVTFVRDLTDAPVAIHLSAASRVWPRIPFRGRVGQQEVSHPAALVDLLALRDDAIFVRFDFPWAQEPEWYASLALDQVTGRREQLQQALDRVRERIDLALDAYRTAQPIAGQTADDEERRRLQYVLDTARHEIHTLSRELTHLEALLGAAGQKRSN